MPRFTDRRKRPAETLRTLRLPSTSTSRCGPLAAKEKLSRAFTPEQASVVRSFVESLPEEITVVVVHYNGGYSRSCAIAQGRHRLYGNSPETEYLSQANSSIFA